LWDYLLSPIGESGLVSTPSTLKQVLRTLFNIASHLIRDGIQTRIIYLMEAFSIAEITGRSTIDTSYEKLCKLLE